MADDFKPRSDLVRTLLERGHVYQATSLAGLDAAALGGRLTGYIGFDATASSLHVGASCRSWRSAGCRRPGTGRSC